MSVGSLRHAVTKSLHSDHSTFSLQPPPLACACEKALAVLFVSKAQLVLPLIFLFVLLFLVSGWLGPRSSLVPVRRMHRSAVVFTPLVLRHIVDLSGFSLRPARVLSSPRQRARIISQAFPRQTRLFVTEVFETFVACLFHFFSALNMSENSLRHYFLLTLLAFGMNLWEQCMAALGLGLMLLLAADRISYGHSLAALLIPPHRRGYFFPIALFAHNISLKRSPRFSHRAVDFLYI